MGKAKVLKKPSTSVKISTSLFHQRKAKHSSSDSSTDSSVPSPQLTKKKSIKGPKPQPKAKPKPQGPKTTTTTTKSGATTKKEKGESKKKVGTKAKEKPKKNEDSKGVKGNQLQGKMKPKEKPKEKLKKDKSISPKPRRKGVARRSQSSNSDSSSSSTDEESSSRTNSPSPPRKTGGGKKVNSPVSKSKSSPKKVPRKEVEKKSVKTSKDKGGAPKKTKFSITTKKGNLIKAKGKQTKPKAKLKRMASLNAKAILEASFSFESSEKKRSPAGTPVKSPKGTGINQETPDLETMDLKPLTLLFSSVTETDFPKGSTSPKAGERKRKSSSVTNIQSMIKTGESPNRRESNASNGNYSQLSPKRRDSESSHSLVKTEKEKSKSPGPKKKAKVTSSSVSTSTSPFEPIEDLIPQHHLYEQQRTLPIPSSDDMEIQRHFTLSAFHSHHNLHSEESTNHFHHHSPGGHKGRGTQTKEKFKSATPTPTNPFGSTVYQPAGPLIEPHKTTIVPAGLLPDTVRIPSDLKVTYQTRPPASTVLTVSTGNQSSKTVDGVSRKSEGRHSGFKTISTSTSTQRLQNKQILHQPYKSTLTESSSSSVTVTTSSTKQPQPTTFIHSPLAVNSTFSAQAGGSMMMSSGGSGPLGGATGTLTQAAALPSHIHPSSTIMATGASASPGSLYFGYGGIHQSPFSPSKYPIVPPDSYRNPSPYLYAPTTPQPPPNYFMTPSFYSAQTLGQPPGASSGLSIGTSQPRPLFAAHHHPSAGGSSVTGVPFYQPPPSAHPVSNYYVTAPPLQPSHHSMQPSTAPGHAGPSHPNPSSQPACPCPTVSSPRSSNSTSNNNNNSTNTTNSNKTNRSLLRKLPQQLPAISVTPPVASVLADVKPLLTKPQRARIARNNSQLPSPLPLSILRLKSNKLLNRKTPPADFTKAKQLEHAKTFTEQYSLPDDITITPIIMNTSQSNTLPFTTYGTHLPHHKTEKKKDIVHVIDTRSGESTTIAKHISINNIHRNSLTPRNVSSVKPNNAGNVGKISPSLDVIVLSPERKQFMNKVTLTNNEMTHIHRGEKVNHQRAALLTSPGHNTERSLNKPVYPIGKIFLTNSNTNLVQPLLQPVTKSENKAKAIRRKGLTLNECIDGLQRKKMRILADTNVSITNVTPALANNSNIQISSSTYDHHQLTIVPTPNSHGHGQSFITNTLDARSRNQLLLNQKPNRKDAKPKQRSIKSLAIEPSRRQGTLSKRTTSTESDFGTKLIDCNAAVAAVSALLIPSPISMFESDTISPTTPYALHNTGMNKRQNEKKKVSLKIKLYKSEEGKITTRSTTQNSKVKTRGNKPGSKAIHFPAQGRSRLLLRDKDGSKSDSSGALMPNFLPYYQQTQGNGSSTLTTSNNHVILRIPKTSGEKVKSEVQSRVTPTYPISSGNMTLNAMKKRAIVKPLSPSLINGAIHSLAMSNKKLPIHTHPRWSNGWRFEGKAFEAKVFIKNDDNPVLRRCYPVMRHDGGDVIRARDCVLLKSGPRKTDLPFVAKVAALFENPADGEMMFSLLWYYRPEHTDIGRNKEDMPDEIFASKHRDSNSVATIEDKCYVFTFNEYCRYKKRLKQLREGVMETTPIVPLSKNQADTRVPVTNFATDIANSVWFGISKLSVQSSSVADEILPNPTPPPLPEPPRPAHPTGKISPEVVFFCRKVYDYRQKRMLKNPS